MSFLQLGMLWALPLALLPVIIHLLNRLRYRTVNWGAMMFLERANKSSTRMARVRQWIVLLLRVLALIALIIGLARPLLGGWLGLSLAGPPDTVILLLDRSASMNAKAPAGGTRLDQAVNTVMAAAQTFGNSSRFVLIDSATCKASQVPAIGLLNELPTAAATDGGASLPNMVSAAVDYLTDNKTGAAEIWIASDLQASSWQPGTPDWLALEARLKALPSAPRIRLLAVDTPAASDLSLSFVNARTTVVNGKYRHELSFNIRQASAETAEKTLTLFDGVNQSPVKIKVAGTLGRYRHVFETEISDQPIMGYLELPADANPGNNRIYFGLGKPALRRALVVGSATDTAAQISQLACTPGDDATEETALISPAAFRPDDLRGIALLVWAAPEPPVEIRKQVEAFVEEGGTLVLAPASDSQTGGKWGGWLVWGAPEAAKDGQPWRIGQWEKTDGPFANTDSGDPLSLDKLAVGKRVAFSGKGIPLGFYADGAPFAMRFKSGGGSTIVLSTSLHPNWSNLGLGTVAVPMMQRLIDEGAKRLAPIRQGIVGVNFPADGASVACLLPRATGDPRTRAGIYQTTRETASLRLCLNRPEAEDESTALTPTEAAGVMRDVPLHVFAEAASGGAAAHSEIWKWLLLLMLAALAFETFLIMPAKPAPPKGTGL